MFYLDDISIPYVWHTIRSGLNDKLYIRLTFTSGGAFSGDHMITLDSKTYSGTQFAAEIQSKITTATSGAVTTCTYDSQSKRMSLSVANLDIHLFTDEELANTLYNIGWSGTAYDVNNPASAN